MEIAFRRAHADGLAALAVQVAPEAPQRCGVDDAQRICACDLLAAREDAQVEIAGGVHGEIFDDARSIAGFKSDARRQARDHARGEKRQRLLRLRGGIAPHVLGEDGKAKRLADERQRRPDRLPACRRPRNERKGRLLGQLGELVCCECIDRGPELDAFLAVRLQAKAGRALPPVTQPDGERVASAQIAAPDADEQRVGVGPDIEPVEPHVELGAIARLHGGEIRRRRLVELRLAHVGGGAPGDLDHPGVVDSELAGGVDQGELGMRARDERPGGVKGDRAHMLGQIGRVRHADILNLDQAGCGRWPGGSCLEYDSR